MRFGQRCKKKELQRFLGIVDGDFVGGAVDLCLQWKSESCSQSWRRRPRGECEYDGDPRVLAKVDDGESSSNKVKGPRVQIFP